MTDTARTLIDHAIHAHLTQGPAAVFSWAVYTTPTGQLAVAIAPAHPPDWEQRGGDHAELERAKAAAVQALQQAHAGPTTSHTVPGISWSCQPAHGRLRALRALTQPPL